MSGRGEQEEKPVYAMGVDIGQVHDYSTLVIVKVDDSTTLGDTRLRNFVLKGLVKWPLGTPYPKIADDIARTCRKLRANGGEIESVTVDATGVGNAVVELIERTFRKHDLRVEVEPFIFTSESKRDLIGNLKVLHQEDRLRFADAKPNTTYAQLLKELIDELINYEVRIEDHGPEKYGVFKTGKHDDLVTALALATMNSSFEIARPRATYVP